MPGVIFFARPVCVQRTGRLDLKQKSSFMDGH